MYAFLVIYVRFEMYDEHLEATSRAVRNLRRNDPQSHTDQ
jgi:hypothetical protein